MTMHMECGKLPRPIAAAGAARRWRSAAAGVGGDGSERCPGADGERVGGGRRAGHRHPRPLLSAELLRHHECRRRTLRRRVQDGRADVLLQDAGRIERRAADEVHRHQAAAGRDGRRGRGRARAFAHHADGLLGATADQPQARAGVERRRDCRAQGQSRPVRRARHAADARPRPGHRGARARRPSCPACAASTSPPTSTATSSTIRCSRRSCAHARSSACRSSCIRCRPSAASARRSYYLRQPARQSATTPAIAAARLIFGGVLDRLPKLEVNLPHAGGVLPILIGRLDHGWKVRTEN